MGPQRRMRIYVGCESPSIVKYLKSSTGDLFIAIFDDYYFDESYFPTLGEEIKKLENKISWKKLSLSVLDPRSSQCELEIKKIIPLQNVANQLPEAFTGPKWVTKSHVPAILTQVRIDIPEGKKIQLQMNLRHAWSVEDQPVPKIKILENEMEQIQLMVQKRKQNLLKRLMKL